MAVEGGKRVVGHFNSRIIAFGPWRIMSFERQRDHPGWIKSLAARTLCHRNELFLRHAKVGIQIAIHSASSIDDFIASSRLRCRSRAAGLRRFSRSSGPATSREFPNDGRSARQVSDDRLGPAVFSIPSSSGESKRTCQRRQSASGRPWPNNRCHPCRVSGLSPSISASVCCRSSGASACQHRSCIPTRPPGMTTIRDGIAVIFFNMFCLQMRPIGLQQEMIPTG